VKLINATGDEACHETGTGAPPRAVRRSLVSDGQLYRRLRELRIKRNLSQADLAEQLGVSKISLWKWERGQTTPIHGNLVALARALGVNPDALLYDAEEAGDFESTSPSLRNVILDAKQKIADCAGTDPGKVKISVEY
jgi:transcriptional regulator with XRE-family HTH domain